MFDEIPTLAEFRDALRSIGEDLIGRPFNYCCDTAEFPATYFFMSMSDEKAIKGFAPTQAYQDYLSSLPPAARNAVRSITDQTVASVNSMVTKDNKITYGIPHDPQKLLAELGKFWDEDQTLDPRVHHALELFFWARNNPGSIDFHYDNTQRLKASYTWMGQSWNASRVGAIFLYDTLTRQGYPRETATLDLAYAIAGKIHKNEDAEVARMLLRPPPSQEPKKAIARLWVAAKSNSVDAKATAQVIGYARSLLDGSWAKLQIGELHVEEKSPVKAPKPKVAPLAATA